MEKLLFTGEAGTGDVVRQKRILFFTSSEYGQANVILAVAHELLSLQRYQIHIASFAPLRQRVQSLNDTVSKGKSPAIFHTIDGLAALEALTLKNEFIGPFPPGVRGAMNTYRMTLPAMADTWTEQEYILSYKKCLDIMREVSPDVIVVDPLISQGLEACNQLSRECVILSPNTFLELLRKQQSLFSQFIRIPTIASGFTYPVPWKLIPANLFLKFALIWILVRNPKIRNLVRYRKSHNLPSLPPVFNVWQAKNHYLVPSIPETDYPCYIPANVTSCGPIILPVAPVSDQDPELYAWLQRSPTVLINLGSHIRMDDNTAREFAVGLKMFLDKQPGVQILWKLKTSGGISVSSQSQTKSEGGFAGCGLNNASLDALSLGIANGRVRIVEWLSVDPSAILQTGLVACSVHHGGSNSFHEALSGGTPQIVLPCWLDTLDFANKVEWLGVGLHGSRAAVPGVESSELSRALLRIFADGEEAIQIRFKAAQLAEIAGKVGGRKKACDKIVEIIEAQGGPGM